MRKKRSFSTRYRRFPPDNINLCRIRQKILRQREFGGHDFFDFLFRLYYNIRMEIYLDYAATTPLDEEVLQEMLPLLKENFGNAASLHGYGRRAAYAVETARERVAETAGVKPSEVFFTSCGTEADNWGVRLLGEGSVCVSNIEHAAVLSAAERRAGGVSYAACNREGAVTADAVERALLPDTGLVAVMAVNNETGCLQPLAEISALCKRKGILMFSDCVQAASVLGLKEICSVCDAISLSAHKVYGPKGAGALIVKNGTLKPLIAGGEQERGLRGGTVNAAAVAGFAFALERAQKGREEYARHTARVRDLFESIVLSGLGERVRADGENRAPNISHLTFANGGIALLSRLDLAGIAASGGAACSVHSARPSHVMLAMGRTEEEARAGVRFSFGKHTTEEQAERAARAVISCCGANE